MGNSGLSASGPADDVLIASMGVMTRGSPAMFARRRRILHEARRLMVEAGVEGVTMRELANRSGVSSRTLYNAFGSKEALIAAAVRQYYDKFLRALSDDQDIYAFDWVLGGIIATNLRNQQIRDYLSVLVGQYFSTSSDEAMRVELRRIAAGFMVPWLEVAEARRQLRRGTDIAQAVSHIASLQYAINQEWLAGYIPDDKFVLTVLRGVLTYLAGFVRGAALEPIESLLLDLNDSAKKVTSIVAVEAARIEDILDSASGLWPVDKSITPRNQAKSES